MKFRKSRVFVRPSIRYWITMPTSHIGTHHLIESPHTILCACVRVCACACVSACVRVAFVSVSHLGTRQHAHYGSLCIAYIGAGGTGMWPASYATAAATGVGTSLSMKPPVAMKARSSRPPKDCDLEDFSNYNMDAVNLRRLTYNSLRKFCAQVLALPPVVPSSPTACGVLHSHLSMYSSYVCFCARCP